MTTTLRLLAILTIMLLFAACGRPQAAQPAMAGEDEPSRMEESLSAPEEPETQEASASPDISESPEASDGEALSQAGEEPPPRPEREADLFAEGVWDIEDRLWDCMPEDLLYAYFDLQYLGYQYMQPVDMSLVLDLENVAMGNLSKWLDDLTQRRRLLYEEDLCYVERERFDYTIRLIEPEELSDDRLAFWADNEYRQESELELHFIVEGEPEKAYPPMMAPNAEHTVLLNRDRDGRWKIGSHYFPGAVRKYYFIDRGDVRSDEQVLEELRAEFAVYDQGSLLMPREGSQPYRGIYAANYALAYAETPNPAFYHVGDWAGNCMNFVSQCVLHGFGSGAVPDPDAAALMTGDWFSGGGGGTFAWENVDYFWDFATAGGPMRCDILAGPSRLRHGDVIQTRSKYVRENEDPEDFSHSLIVVDPTTLLLAQNSPACYVYYSDLVNTRRRFLRPAYMD